MKRLYILGSPFLIYLLYGVALSQFRLEIFKQKLQGKIQSSYYDYRGVTHAHSDRSSGTATFSEIIHAAQEANLDFVILTDLNDFEPAHTTTAYYSKVLFINAAEYSYVDSHLLYYEGPKGQSFSGGGQAQVTMTDLLSQSDRSPESGFIVLAHPAQAGYEWTGDYPEGLDGIEVMNLASSWEHAKAHTPASLGWSFLAYPFNPHLAIFRLFDSPDEELRLWDKLLAQKRMAGFLGNDTSARAFTWAGRVVQFPSYRTSFEVATNHVLLTSELTGDPIRDQKKITSALKNGQFYMSIDTIAQPEGFIAEMKMNRKTYPLGSNVSFQKGLELHVSLPDKPLVPFETVILKDGERYVTSNSQKTNIDIQKPGIYRIMVRVSPTLPLPDGKRWFPWIYTNAFYVRP